MKQPVVKVFKGITRLVSAFNGLFFYRVLHRIEQGLSGHLQLVVASGIVESACLPFANTPYLGFSSVVIY